MRAEKAMDAFGWCALRVIYYSDSHRVTRSKPSGLRVSPQGRLYERLEPCEGKLSCTVLRGEEGREPLALPDPREDDRVNLWGLEL